MCIYFKKKQGVLSPPVRVSLPHCNYVIFSIEDVDVYSGRTTDGWEYVVNKEFRKVKPKRQSLYAEPIEWQAVSLFILHYKENQDVCQLLWSGSEARYGGSDVACSHQDAWNQGSLDSL